MRTINYSAFNKHVLSTYNIQRTMQGLKLCLQIKGVQNWFLWILWSKAGVSKLWAIPDCFCRENKLRQKKNQKKPNILWSTKHYMKFQMWGYRYSNIVLLEHSHTPSFLFCQIMLSDYDGQPEQLESFWSMKPKIFSIWLFDKKTYCWVF